jgi:hypothetical protein
MDYKLYFLFSALLALLGFALFCGSIYWGVQIYKNHKEYKNTFNENDPKNKDENGNIKYPLETSAVISQLVMFYFMAYIFVGAPLGGAFELWQTGNDKKI